MTKALKITDKEKRNLREKAKAELVRLNSITDNFTINEKIERFKSKYAKCEIIYKIILEEHQFYKTGVRKNRLKVDMRQVPYALDFVGYDFNRELLKNLFGSNDENGKRSAKKIRDDLNHLLSKKVVEELLNREKELHEIMDTFLSKIESFDK